MSCRFLDPSAFMMKIWPVRLKISIVKRGLFFPPGHSAAPHDVSAIVGPHGVRIVGGRRRQLFEIRAVRSDREDVEIESAVTPCEYNALAIRRPIREVAILRRQNRHRPFRQIEDAQSLSVSSHSARNCIGGAVHGHARHEPRRRLGIQWRLAHNSLPNATGYRHPAGSLRNHRHARLGRNGGGLSRARYPPAQANSDQGAGAAYRRRSFDGRALRPRGAGRRGAVASEYRRHLRCRGARRNAVRRDRAARRRNPPPTAGEGRLAVPAGGGVRAADRTRPRGGPRQKPSSTAT